MSTCKRNFYFILKVNEKLLFKILKHKIFVRNQVEKPIIVKQYIYLQTSGSTIHSRDKTFIDILLKEVPISKAKFRSYLIFR